MTSPSSLAEGALALACEGPVLPLAPAGKRPLGGLGLHQATSDMETVSRWWETWPDANVGLRCDGLVAVDVDGDPGEQSLAGLEYRFGALPATRAAKTGKGRHLFFACPVPVGNSTAALGHPEGVDLRGGARGYVVAPPSRHVSGCRYEWLDRRPPAEIPAGWRETLTAVRYTPGIAREAMIDTDYGRRALECELERLLRAKPGSRNEALNVSVFRLAQLVAGGQLARKRVEDSAIQVALLLGLGLRESRVTVRSAMTAGLAFPRFPSRARDNRGF